MSVQKALNRLDFVGRWRLWFGISGILLLLGIGAIALGGLNFGIDFVGGAKFTAAGVEEGTTVAQVRAALPEDLRGDAIIQSTGTDGYEIRTSVLEEGESSRVSDALAE